MHNIAARTELDSAALPSVLGRRVSDALDRQAPKSTWVRLWKRNGNKPALEGVGWDWENLLAYTRILLAIACATIVCFDGAYQNQQSYLSRYSSFTYVAFGLLNLVIVRLDKHRGWRTALGLEAAEVGLTSVIISCTGGPQSLFLGLYLFVLLVAACKWGLNGAVFTAGACTLFFFVGLLLPGWWAYAPATGGKLSVAASLVLAAILLASACLLGMLVETDRRRYGDTLAITHLLRSVIPEPGFASTLGNILLAIRDHFDADLIRLAIQEVNGDRAEGWEVTRFPGRNGQAVRSWKLSQAERRAFFAVPPGFVQGALGVSRKGLPPGRTPKNRDGFYSRPRQFATGARDTEGLHDLQVISEAHSPIMGSWSLLAATFAFKGQWLGRLTIYNPRGGRRPKSDARFLGILVREVAPAVHSKYLVETLRSRAQARERLRLSQNLHDGILQTLIGLEMQMDVLRRGHQKCEPSCPMEEMGRLQQQFHNEIANLREEMQRLKPLQVEPVHFLDNLARTVDKFGREVGISASFVTESQEVFLAPRVCTDLVRIAQEALANVRKHSGAHTVLVHFARENGYYKLCIEDDGRGFGFTGRLSSGAIEASAYCPLVIKERVDAIGGELIIESVQGSGARIEVLVPGSADGGITTDY